MGGGRMAVGEVVGMLEDGVGRGVGLLGKLVIYQTLAGVWVWTCACHACSQAIILIPFLSQKARSSSCGR